MSLIHQLSNSEKEKEMRECHLGFNDRFSDQSDLREAVEEHERETMRITKITIDNEHLRRTQLRFQIGTIECTINMKELVEREFREQLGEDVTDKEIVPFVDIEFYH